MTIEFWFLIGAALVFWMQAGFAMVETGFTRAKNAGNIIMKNLMDFCLGTVVFACLGYSIMMGEDSCCGLIGKPNFDLFTNFRAFIASPSDGTFTTASIFVFNLVFCATTATIVSGAMAERTKFSAYCLYSCLISLAVYPIEAHWIWGGGWLSERGFHDFAGSCAIHMVGGLAALVGAIMLGPRIGKYKTDEKGNVVKVNAIPGHSISLGALGVFILWLGWYGFNGAAATSPSQLASIFLTTTIAPACATCATMCATWIKNGKPDVSMCLNASLAGLVGITAGCDSVDACGAAIIGLVAGFIVVLVVEALDLRFHIDDPVGAVGVHMACGMWGALAVGLLSTPAAPAGLSGFFYTGSVELLKIQVIGVLSVGAYSVLVMTLVFVVINKTVGLRVKAEDEIVGLDLTEHALPSAYPDFAPAVNKYSAYSSGEGVEIVRGDVPVAEAVVVKRVPSFNESRSDDRRKMTKIEIICKESRFDALKNAMTSLGITGMTVSHVLGCGVQGGRLEYYRGVQIETNLLPKIQVNIVVSKIPVRDVIETAKKTLYTGRIGDGKIFVYDVENVVKVRTGEEGYDALQDSE